MTTTTPALGEADMPSASKKTKHAEAPEAAGPPIKRSSQTTLSWPKRPASLLRDEDEFIAIQPCVSKHAIATTTSLDEGDEVAAPPDDPEAECDTSDDEDKESESDCEESDDEDKMASPVDGAGSNADRSGSRLAPASDAKDQKSAASTSAPRMVHEPVNEKTTTDAKDRKVGTEKLKTGGDGVTEVQAQEEYRTITTRNGKPNPKYVINRLGDVKYVGPIGKERSVKVSRQNDKMYPYYVLSRRTHQAHVLVARAFIPNTHPKKRPIVDHIDGEKGNMRWTNLEWVSHKENARRAVAMGLTKGARKVGVVQYTKDGNTEIKRHKSIVVAANEVRGKRCMSTAHVLIHTSIDQKKAVKMPNGVECVWRHADPNQNKHREPIPWELWRGVLLWPSAP